VGYAALGVAARRRGDSGNRSRAEHLFKFGSMASSMVDARRPPKQIKMGAGTEEVRAPKGRKEN